MNMTKQEDKIQDKIQEVKIQEGVTTEVNASLDNNESIQLLEQYDLRDEPMGAAQIPGHQRIRLLTFNTWGLKYVSKLREQRLRAIAHRLAQDVDQYDVVALQEIWCEQDWHYLSQQCCDKFAYRRLFKSGIITGPGLAILSKIPIEATWLYRFPINGRPSAFFRGDWLVGKSIAVTILKPSGVESRPVAILNSHMHAPYAQSGDASYSTHRAVQAWDLAQIVKMLQKANYAVIQVGDLNSKPGSLPYKLFTVEAGLRDSWDVLHGHSDVDMASLTPEEQIESCGVTCDSRLNTWRAHRASWEACRLDYALIDPRCVKPVKAAVKFTERLPAPYNCSYSDHFAFSAEFVINSSSTSSEETSVQDKLDVYQELVAEIGWYRAHTIPFQARWRRWHLILSLVAVVAIHVVSNWAAAAAPWSSILLVFASTVIGISGVVNGMIWYFGVRSESRALQEVQLEVEDMFRSTERSLQENA